MENNFQQAYQAPVQQAYQAPPAQPMYGVPYMVPDTMGKMPGLVSFLMKLTAFFIPVLGFILGCLVNLTPYDNKKEVSDSILRISCIWFILTLIGLAISFVILIFALIISGF